ncbi:hypothetical protein PHMEG_00021647 [Phytophthora megakarya]|uniref:Chromo domain-containing protein n=1 Tax=Phytophthora megakarya TaxID=4795 RepID=A0A225VLC2_9STRA|nr:hypothetical protein PHMEG_00021647 [Phytophthora megakarya]
MQSVKVYVEDPLQQDWDEIAERLVFAINNSHDMTRKETLFYLVHGWDAHTTLRTMSTSLKRGVGRQTEALAWRRDITCQQQIALEMAKEYQAAERARRARIRDEKLGRKEQAALPKIVNGDSTDDDSEPKSLFRPGSRVWLYMGRVKPGLVKKLIHRWHGPFRVKRKVEEFAYGLEVPDNKAGIGSTGGARLSAEGCERVLRSAKSVTSSRIAEDTRFDFDEELLPGNQVKLPLNLRKPMPTSTDRPVREFEVKWVCYESTTWEPASNLSCGGLLYDYLRNKKSEQRLQIVKVADED